MNKKETTLKVEGMSCGSCVRHVEGALRKLDGVAAIEVTLAERKVRVEHDPEKATVAALIGAIAAAGYESGV